MMYAQTESATEYTVVREIIPEPRDYSGILVITPQILNSKLLFVFCALQTGKRPLYVFALPQTPNKSKSGHCGCDDAAKAV